MRTAILALLLAGAVSLPAGAQVAPRAPHGWLRRHIGGLLAENARTWKDLVTFRDWKWSVATFGMAAAMAYDGHSTAELLGGCAGCYESWSHLLVGRRPSPAKLALAQFAGFNLVATASHRSRSRYRVLMAAPFVAVQIYAGRRNGDLLATCSQAGIVCR